MDDAHIKEASTAAQMAVGWSAYLHGIGYSVEQFRREVEEAAAYIKSRQKR